jgi:hypothetical protein
MKTYSAHTQSLTTRLQLIRFELRYAAISRRSVGYHFPRDLNREDLNKRREMRNVVLVCQTPMCNAVTPGRLLRSLVLLGLARLLRLMELDGVVNVAQDSAETVLVLHVQLEKGHHAEAVNELRDSLVQLVE